MRPSIWSYPQRLIKVLNGSCMVAHTIQSNTQIIMRAVVFRIQLQRRIIAFEGFFVPTHNV